MNMRKMRALIGDSIKRRIVPMATPTNAPTIGTIEVMQMAMEMIAALGILRISIPIKHKVPKIRDSVS